MAQQTINVGAAPNDGTGTPLRTAFQYTNSNFTELYTATGPSGNNINVPGAATITGDLTVDTNTLFVDSANNRVGIGTVTPATPLNIGTAVSRHFLANGQTTGSSYGEITTTGADVIYGAVDAAAGLFTNAIANASFFGSGNATSLQLITNSTSRYEISSTGVATWSNVGGVAGTAMTLNSTGLGVGGSAIGTKLEVVTSASGSIGGTATVTNSAATAIGNAASLNFRTNSNFLAAGYFGARIEAVTPAASNSTDLVFYNYKGVTTSGDETMRITSGGNVGIGVTPSAWGGSYKALQLQSVARNIAATGAGSGDFTVAFNAIYDSTDSRWEYAATGDKAGRYSQTGSGNHRWFVSNTAGTAGNEITDFASPAMTLDASGNLLVTKTSYGLTVGFAAASTGSIDSVMASSVSAQSTLNVYSTGAAAFRFYVGMDGTVNATNATISAISDARLKENVQDIDVGLGAILALKPRKFDWKAGKGKDIKGDRGFIAQEFEQVFPNLIDEWKDPASEGEAPYKSVRQDLIPVLVKAIQELAARVQTLEAK